MKFKEFLENRSQNTWRPAPGQPHYSNLEQRPSRPNLDIPYVQNISTEDFSNLYYYGVYKKDKEKLKQLFNYLKNKYIKIFYRKFDKLPVQTIEDAFQESIIKLLEQKFSKKDNIEGYFRRTMNNKILDILKSKGSTSTDTAELEPDQERFQPINLLISQELREKISSVIEDIINKIDGKKVAAFCLGFGLGCYENGKIKIPERFQFGPIYKLLTTGDFSDKLDYDYIVKELAKKKIKINKAQITSAFLQIRNFILQKLNESNLESNLSFKEWIQI